MFPMEADRVVIDKVDSQVRVAANISAAALTPKGA
jgi:hypothetical protein